MSVFNHTLGTDPVWVARYRVTSPMVHAKSWDGYVRQCFNGACLDWLNPEQEAHFLRMGLVERIPDAERPAIAADAPQTVDLEADGGADDNASAPEESGAVDECVAALAHLEVPATAGAPTARTALRDAGHRFGNDVIAHAVKRRKELSGTATDDEKDASETVRF
jgi:hypothetical protein